MFRDRIEAGHMLASRLKKYANEPGVVLAVPRGGVPVGYVVARELNLPLDLLLSKKIGHPASKEYAIGAVSLHGRVLVPHKGIARRYIDAETALLRDRLREMYKKYRGDRQPETITGKTVIVVDDGVATGHTLLVTIEMLKKKQPARIVIAVPVAPPSALNKLAEEVDEVVCLLSPNDFPGVGAFYYDFEQVTDQEVKDYLERLPPVTDEILQGGPVKQR